ncbi:F-box only protein 39-like isoform X1 [Xyrichtys novacula]|uniref:F-box only protein 39-like isoform X1 n=1 Tax=Xyrichtys novacula TaxID=13765 RepID=A0AAV1FTT1_XYRNO|nr:F-box only protein 39-like isoform X1 [Xyrichtys novacula]
MDKEIDIFQSDREEEFERDSSDPPDEDQRDSSEQEVGWGSLLDMCLRHIFEFLEDRDRRSAQLTCRHWHHVMRSPSLWRSRYFNFTGRHSRHRPSEYSLAVPYARSLGVYLQTMEVWVVPPRKPMMARRLEQTISGLLSELTRVRAPLHTMYIIKLELDKTQWTSSQRASIVNNLVAFFRRGGLSLTSVCLYGMQNNLAHGLDLLSALVYSQTRLSPQNFISTLDLTKFFSSSVHVHSNFHIPHFLGHLKSLTNLSLSYSCLSDQLLAALQYRPHRQNQQPSRDRGPLHTLALRCSWNEHHEHTVSGSSWTSLASTCPGLKVRFDVDQIIDTNRLARFLLPEIPLTGFTMTAFYSIDSEWSARPVLLDLLPQYRRSLQYLTLDLSNCSEPLDEELLQLVELCECLQDLRVWAFLDISTVARLLHIRLTRRRLLNKIIVRIYSLNGNTEEGEEQLEEIMSSYPQLPPELDFSARVDPSYDLV